MTEQSQTTQNPNIRYLRWAGFLLLLLGLTLPFHYVPSALKMFPKDHFTFKHTIITQEDVDDVIKRYNNAGNILEQNAMNNDPFIRTLREEGIIVDKSKRDNKENDLSEKSQTSNHSVNSEVAFLANYNEKYPNEVNLLNNPTIKERLKNLIGNRFSFLEETWAVESPIKVVNNTFIASGCQAHNCSATNFIIVVNLESNIMYVGIREEEVIKTYSEDGTISTYIEEWKNNN